MSRTVGRKSKTQYLVAGASMLAIAANMAGTAMAQDAEDDEDVVVVRGIRQSLQNAQELKRDADTFVDAISAADIGALPDRSVSEALQRVPGVNVLRFAGPNDPDHFAVEGSGVTIRGFPFVRSELNGRDVFGASSAGILGFEDVSPELLGSVVVFKNQSADLIEGGLVGTIDLRTRVPFDDPGPNASFSIEGTYSDFSEEFDPSFSGVVSNTWETDAGRFGILLNGSFGQLNSRSDAVAVSAFDEVTRDDTGGVGYVPAGIGLRTQLFDRERIAYGGALQWESNDRRWLATAQFLRSDSTLQWGENVIETASDGAGSRDNLDQSDFVFDDSGLFRSGTISDNSQWRGPNGTAALVGATGGQQILLRRERLEEDVTSDFGVNVKFAPQDNLRFNFDVQYVDSETDIVDLTNHFSFFAPFSLEINGDDESPDVTFLLPDGAPADYFQNPSNYFFRSAMDHITQNNADSIAFRGDVEYDFSGDGWIKSVRAGARYSDQETTLRQSDFNWANISEVWTGVDVQGQANGNFDDFQSLVLAGGNPNADIEALVSPLAGGFSFSGFNREGLASTGLGGPIPIWTGPGVNDYQAWSDAVTALRIAGRGGDANAISPTLINRDGVIEGTPFTLGEIGEVSRETFALYTRFDFGHDSVFDSGVAVDGNFGVRYVRTDRSVDAAFNIPGFSNIFQNAAVCDPDNPQRLDPTFEEPGLCALDLASLETFFGNGETRQETIDVDYDYWLPSLNARFDFGNDQYVRFAISRTLSRPSIDQINERIEIGTLPDEVVSDGAGGNINTFGGFTGAGFGASGTGNASLLPQLATNIDLSWEWYFSDSGSITAGVFYKDIENYINFEPAAITVENNGVTLATDRNTEVNSDENASLAGFEVAYQQFYDFLPAPFDGIGAQINYTYIDAEGVEPIIDSDLPSDDPPVAQFAVDRGVFPRVSEHNLNLIGLYEKGPWQGRLAYNWRSEFQLTPRDVIFPFATIYQPATGQLDGSVFYSVNDTIRIGVQAVNITDDITVTQQSINEDGLLGPRAFNRNDRRVSFILRGTY